MVNKESATIEFISERIVQGKSDSIIDTQLSDAEYKKKSDMFLKKLGLGKDLEFVSVNPSITVEYIDENNTTVKKPIRIEVTYKKKPVDGIEFEGVGPGIKVEFDSSGEIVSFFSVNRDVKKINLDYAFKINLNFNLWGY